MSWHIPSRTSIKDGILNIAGENVRVENYVIVEPVKLSQAQENTLEKLPLWERLQPVEKVSQTKDQEQAEAPKKAQPKKRKRSTKK